MKIAVSNIAWDRTEDAAIARLLKQYGIRGIDIAPGKIAADPLALSSAEIRAFVDFWQAYDIQIVGMQSLLFGQPDLRLFGDAAARRRMGDYLQAIIRLAAQLGVRSLVFGSPQNRQAGGLHFQQALDIAAAFFNPLAEYAYQHDTILCLEPNPAQYGCDFVTTTAEALLLVQRVGHPGFRLHLDSAAMTLSGEDIAEALQSAIGLLAHFHVSEPQLGPVGPAGTVDHTLFAEQLHKLGYEQWISIEMRSGSTRPDATSVEAALAFVTATYGTA